MLFAVVVFAAVAQAQNAALYSHVSRVTWVVENIDRARPAWEKLGLTDIHEYPNITLTGTYHGKPVEITAWQITGRLGSMTVDMIQPAEGELNAYNHFLGQHGPGIFAVVYRVPNAATMQSEIARLKSRQVGVLQQTTVKMKGVAPVTTIYFDTEPVMKFAVGITNEAEDAATPSASLVPAEFNVQAIADAGSTDAALKFWQRNFNAGPTRGITFGWTVPAVAPADFSPRAIERREGIRYIDFSVDDLDKSTAAFTKLGYHVMRSGTEAGDHPMHYALIDGDKAGGVQIELAQSK